MEYKLSCNKTSRLVETLYAYIMKYNIAHLVCKKSYDLKKERNIYQIWEHKGFMTPEKAVDELIEIANILQLDLTKSGIKCSRGFEVFSKK